MANVRALLHTPDHIIPFAVVPIGYPAEHPIAADRYDRGRVHFDCW